MKRFLACALVVALAGCAASTGSQRVVGDVSGDFPGVETDLTVEPAAFAVGDSIRVVLAISNINDRKVLIQFTDFRQIGLVVYDAVGDVTCVDDHTLTAPVHLSLGPFETWRREIVWDGRVLVRRQPVALDPGRYALEAGLRPYGDILLNRSNTVEIEIVRHEE
jgi:hypothetical protein